MSTTPIAVHPETRETYVSDWVTAKIMCEPTVFPGAQMGAVSIFFNPGEGHARHNHPDAEQIIYVISGEAEMMIEHEAGKPRYETIRTGSLVHIPRGAYHSTFNVGWEPVRILAVYHPPGPETVMREAEGFEVIPPRGRQDRAGEPPPRPAQARTAGSCLAADEHALAD